MVRPNITVKVKINHSAMVAQVSNISENALSRAAEISRNRYKTNILLANRIHTGEMSESVQFHIYKVNDLKSAAVIGTPKTYAKYQEFGTRAHGPVRAKVLRFKPKGSNKFVYAKWVRGVTPAKFAQRTLDMIRPSDYL